MNPPPFASMSMGGVPGGPSLPPAPQPMVPPGHAPSQLTPPAVSGQAQAVLPATTATTLMAPGSIPGGQAPSPGAPPGQVPPGAAAAAAAPGVRMAAGPPPPTPPSAAFPAMRSFAPPQMMPNFMSAPPVPMQPQQQMMPPGVLGTSPAGMPPRYSAPQFSPMGARPPPSAFVPRPPLGPPPPVTMSAMSLPRPAGNGLRPIPPVLKPPPGMSLTELAAKGVGQLTAPPEKPHTTVYVGKIAPTIEDDFLRALLELCGEIKSWKRAQDPTTGSPKGFGFCEFESAEGVLRALRILNKYNLEGQELVLNVNQATREYLERYVAKKKERERFLQQQAAELEKDEELAPGVESIEAPKPSIRFGKDDSVDKDSRGEDDAKKFGLVSSADIQADELATKKLNSMLEERSRLRPLPPPPPLPSSQDGLKSVDTASKSRDGDVSAEATKSDDPSGKNDDDTTSDLRASADNDMTSADKGGRRSERDRERDREREIEREKERELERYEMARERDRARREREREMKIREAERIYEEREREWEAREREKERQRLHDREREKDRERDRRKEIKEQEDESDDEDWKKSRYRGSLLDEKRKRRLREREEDLADREREEHEMLTKRQKIVDSSAGEKESDGEDDEMDVVEDDEEDVMEVLPPKTLPTADSFSVDSVSDAEEEQPQNLLNSNGTHNAKRQAEEKLITVVSGEVDPKASPALPRKLGFGIMGSGRRATGLSVFHQEEEEEKTDDRRLRPLVPIDYSAEEMEAVATPNPPPRASSPQVAPNLAAAAEFARSLSGFAGSGNIASSKEDRKEDGDRDRSSRRKRDRHEERDSSRKEKTRDRDRDRERDREPREEREREREREKDRERKESGDREREKDHVAAEKIKVAEPKKILNAKQLIDTIPKTKEELFAYPVDWNIYDKHDLHERMRPWISKKITEFLGEEETTLVDFIVSNTCKHVTAASMLDLLESILDDEAELFVLKMWRMLIFEIRRIETGLASSKSKS